MAAYYRPGSAVGVGSGETALLAAVLRQAMLDVQSRRRDVRLEAEQFWQDAVAVAVVLPINSPAVTHKAATTQSARGQNSI
jgi:hypothetical protein